MKKMILAFMLIANVSVAQENVKALSKTDAFSAKTGTLIQRELQKVGSVKVKYGENMNVEILSVTDLVTKENSKAIRLSALVTTSLSRDTKAGSLDTDEVEAALKSLNLIKTATATPSPENYTEIKFMSRGELLIGCYSGKPGKEWTLFVKMDRFDSNSYVYIDKDNIDSLIGVLTEAKSKL